MFTRHALITAAAFCALAPALALDAPATTSQPLRATGAYPIRQDASQWLGSNLIGARVVSATSETIGKVANLVVNENGSIEAAVIAIGGVFGVGAKEVAVNYRSLNIERNRNGDGIGRVVLAATKNDLRQAADFKTLSEQKAERTARHAYATPATPVKLTTPLP